MSAFKAPPFLDGTFDKLQTSWQDSTMPTLNFRQIKALTQLIVSISQTCTTTCTYPTPCFYGNDAHAPTVVPRPRSRLTERQLESLVKQTVVAYVCTKKNGRRPISTVKMKARRSCSRCHRNRRCGPVQPVAAVR